MIDFHSHILPQFDDGAASLAESLSMLRQSFLQGVDVVVSTSHFYGNEEYPREFLRRREAAYRRLWDAMLMSTEVYPRVVQGAEVLYFPGMGEAEEIAALQIGNTGTILIEPPMIPWTDEMLDEILRFGENFHCTPVIAHVDRFMNHLKDRTLMERVRERGMLVQVNGEFFLNPETAKTAVSHLKKGHIQLIGSDCHDLTRRPPNMGLVRKQARAFGVEAEFNRLHKNARELLRRGGNTVE